MSRYYPEEQERPEPEAPTAPAEHYEPSSSAEAEEALEGTRGRISETLDQLESRLRERKEELKGRADALRPIGRQVESNPWRTLSIALGAGFVLGRRQAKRRRAR